MSRIAIKICGLSTPEALDAAIEGGASHAGFVHFPKSPRHVDMDRLAALSQRAPAHLRKVGVVVDPDDALIEQLVRVGKLDAIQFHGKESPERLAVIRSQGTFEVWKAVPVKTAADIATASAYKDSTDRILFDAKTPDTADLPGGMGLRFDWRLLQGYRNDQPWGLSGGLDTHNIAEAIRLTQAPLVDVSSGVESAPGIKNVDKIITFCKAIQQL
jgi:phosphoribosylanthranilate isomerase